MLAFKRGHVCKQGTELNDIEGLPQSNIANCHCFKEVNSQAVEDHSAVDHNEISDDELLECVRGMFHEVGDEVDEEERECVTSMEEVLQTVDESEHVLSKLPVDFDMHQFLLSLKGESVPEAGEDDFGTAKNNTVDTAINNIHQFSSLVQIIWYTIFLLLLRNLKENLQDVSFSVKDMKDIYQQSLDISRTAEFKGWLKMCFRKAENVDLSPAERSFGMDIVTGVLHNVLHVVCEAVRERSHDEMVSGFAVSEMDDVGRGKVRFVGAWAVGRVLNKAKKYVRDNLYTSNRSTRNQVNKALSKIEALESTVVVPYDILCGETRHPGTLNVTESRQFRTHGLIHVSDDYYYFALELEQKRLNGLNNKMLKTHGDRLIDVLEESLLKDEQLISLWKALFSQVDVLVRCLTIIIQHVKLGG